MGLLAVWSGLSGRVWSCLEWVLPTGCPKKRTNKTNKNGQTWQACQHSKVVQRGPKGPEIVNLDVFDNLGPF